MRRPVGLRRFFTPSNRKGIKMSDEKKLTTAEEISLTDIITSLETGETIADYVKGLADQFERSEDLLVGPTDCQVAAVALHRLAASL
jgi:hypothetical protein